MSPKEKALELIGNMGFSTGVSMDAKTGEFRSMYRNQYAKQCALVAVDEIINSEPRHPSNIDWDDCGGTHQYYYEAQREEAAKYWQEVKQELDKM